MPLTMIWCGAPGASNGALQGMPWSYQERVLLPNDGVRYVPSSPLGVSAGMVTGIHTESTFCKNVTMAWLQAWGCSIMI